MNERIKELFSKSCWDEQMEADIEDCINVQQFAELIIKECVDVLVTEMNRLDELNRVVAAQTLDTAQVLIKQHFGVEE